MDQNPQIQRPPKITSIEQQLMVANPDIEQEASKEIDLLFAMRNDVGVKAPKAFRLLKSINIPLLNEITLCKTHLYNALALQGFYLPDRS